MKKINFEKFKKVFTYLCLAAYVCCVGVLVVEASMNGTKSANQSNTVGGGIADIINNGAGDTSVAIEPTEVKITNKDAIDISIVENLKVYCYGMNDNSGVSWMKGECLINFVITTPL